MFQAFGQFFAMFFALFSAGEKLGKSLDNLATIAVDESEGLRNLADLSREERYNRAVKRLEQSKLDVKDPTPVKKVA